MPNPFESIPPRIRQGLYLAYALVGLGLAVAAVYGVDVSQHASALAVVGAAFGFTAAANTPATKAGKRRDETGAVSLSPADHARLEYTIRRAAQRAAEPTKRGRWIP